MIQWLRTHRYGVMGTIIFHLLLGIVLLATEITRLETHAEIEIRLDMPEPEVVQQKKEEQERKKEIRERTTDDEVQKLLRSMAVNENARPTSQQTKNEELEKYIREIQEELQGRYGDRYAARKDGNHELDSLLLLRDKKQRELDSLQSTLYVGESSVTYSLKEPDRYQRFLPIPVFKCEFGGKVAVAIVVNRKGAVIKAEVIGSESNEDASLREVAVDAALRSRFNEDENAPAQQQGRITYNFVKQ